MPNIAITSYCNLKCPYCFAQQMFKDEKIKNISLDTFKHILKWIEPIMEIKKERIGIIGGEPTLHPNFPQIMEITSAFCQKYNTSSILFTNGIELNNELIKSIPDQMKILLNYNSQLVYTNENLKKINNNLTFLNDIGWINPHKLIFGITMCDEIKDYSFFKQVIEKYQLEKVRIAIDRSNGKWYLPEYYLTIKPLFLDLINYFISINLQQIDIECRIPITYFTQNEQELIFQVIPREKYLSTCHPAFEIFPDFTMSSCFTHFSYINCNQYKNFKDFLEINKVNLIGGISQHV